jgi:DNA-directed RNA polymerase
MTPVSFDIGQICRIERIHDCRLGREENVEEPLRLRYTTRNARRRAAELARKLDDENDWAKNYRSYYLGEKLISLALRHARVDGQPFFEMKTENESYGKSIKTMQRIGLTEAAEEWLGEHSPDVSSLFCPIYLTMFVRPRPWTSLSDGGYLITPLTLFKRQTGKKAQRLLEKADLSALLSAVNAIQNTAYRINKDIQRQMQAAFDAGLPFFKLKEDAKTADDLNHNKGIRKVTAFRLLQAAELLNEPHFYFPHQLDHRGRAYPVPQLMNPQSDDMGRAPLEFADGKRLGERGAECLAIYLANCYFKKEKVSFQKRRYWVHENEQEIIDFAANPLPEASPCRARASRRLHRFWKEADKPWMLLAACHEWKRYREEGPDCISHLPISVDGSCNGYQHLSAMGLDPIGGRATNLIPGVTPEDIYQWVADLVSRIVEIDAQRPGPIGDAAWQLLGKIDRGLVKVPTMTTPYGVTRRTICEQLLDSDTIKACNVPEQCAQYLAPILEKCIREVAVQAGRIMEWLQKLADIIARANRGMMWITPIGLLVFHESRAPKEVRLIAADRSLLIYQVDEKRKISAQKQVNGIAANLVHSMDGAHMMLTTNRLYAAGIRHFAMVHDSYGVHAADVDLLNRLLREEFVRIYSEPVLQNFLDQLRKANPGISLPDPPQTGDLDIQQVLSSPYFFA